MSLCLLHRMWNIINMDWSPVTIKLWYDTVTTYTSIHHDRTKSNPTYCNLKTYTLHSIWLLRFITVTMRDWIQHEIRVLTSLATYPVLHLIIVPKYWLTVTYAVIFLLYITLLEIVSHPKLISTNWKPRERHKLKMQYINRNEMCHPYHKT